MGPKHLLLTCGIASGEACFVKEALGPHNVEDKLSLAHNTCRNQRKTNHKRNTSTDEAPKQPFSKISKYPELGLPAFQGPEVYCLSWPAVTMLDSVFTV